MGCLLFLSFFFQRGGRKTPVALGPRMATHSLASLEYGQLAGGGCPTQMTCPYVTFWLLLLAPEMTSGAKRGLKKDTLPPELLGTNRTSLWDVEASPMWDGGGELGSSSNIQGMDKPAPPLPQPSLFCSSFAPGDEIRPPYQKTKLSLWNLVRIPTWLSRDSHPQC